ncbi:GntR family transcriptional regulator [Acuticoccus sp. MNP-M23]|uniref:GntR family transcriptional regulator n=1 Tax=Acuticoccus sp. MNP-M23 TaxID=3072793 RepID=UPI002814A8B2|nr:GntR family transcriptional regulator [Acuticoccus sp. MNP-M23]WMS42917.1 GntR family transcriptional regulator [Acuticoccus sp. MNP-M23]
MSVDARRDENGPDLPPAAIRPRGTLSDQAYQSLSLLIRERELRAGEPLVEQHLAARLGVSRTPLRHAMQRLEAEGLLRKVANRSHIVRQVELKEYLQSLRVRETLEAEAAALAAGSVPEASIAHARQALESVRASRPYDMLAHWRSDDEVHRLFIDHCGNEVMTRIILSLRVTTQLFEIDRLVDRLEPDSREHELILDALEAGDAKATRRAVAAHIRSLFRFAVSAVG